jgi:hypothetical protein
VFQKTTTGVRHGTSPAKLAKCSPDTALRDIRELLDQRMLLQNPAGGRSTSYRLAEQTGRGVD